MEHKSSYVWGRSKEMLGYLHNALGSGAKLEQERKQSLHRLETAMQSRISVCALWKSVEREIIRGRARQQLHVMVILTLIQ